jgi:hypothetical protein
MSIVYPAAGERGRRALARADEGEIDDVAGIMLCPPPQPANPIEAPIVAMVTAD